MRSANDRARPNVSGAVLAAIGGDACRLRNLPRLATGTGGRWLRLLVIPYWKAIKSVRLSVTDLDFNGSFVRLALPEFKTL